MDIRTKETGRFETEIQNCGQTISEPASITIHYESDEN
jgi:hypothetical protein